MIADDFKLVDHVCASRFDTEALAALARIKAAYQQYLDAATRCTDLANKWHQSIACESEGYGEKLRDALGPAYLGGPLQ